MTSNEILMLKFKEWGSSSELVWLKEIAYQLAKLNEATDETQRKDRRSDQ
jgi:hypothetical protein